MVKQIAFDIDQDASYAGVSPAYVDGWDDLDYDSQRDIWAMWKEAVASDTAETCRAFGYEAVITGDDSLRNDIMRDWPDDEAQKAWEQIQAGTRLDWAVAANAAIVGWMLSHLWMGMVP